eukprot:TRINITY_DN12912_c1_g1_i1.p1 TRINITY_DN12912_c1_g1~~TRINITY_DN12912_c1_g1_i1.p1  ORF type:complete len:251 (+),score=29.98 TRINITY_DN12912_c1_g1_i1:58-753(+)
MRALCRFRSWAVVRRPRRSLCRSGRRGLVDPAQPTDGTIIRVSGLSNTSRVAGACVATLEEHGHCTLSAIGWRAINQATKAAAQAFVFRTESGKGIIVRNDLARVVVHSRRLPEDSLGVLIKVLATGEQGMADREHEAIFRVRAETVAKSLGNTVQNRLAGSALGQHITIEACGPAVYKAAAGLAWARHFCRLDPSCTFDVGYVPGWTVEESHTAVRMQVRKMKRAPPRLL